MESPIIATYNLSKDEIHEIVAEAARLGAKKALYDIGLHDDEAGSDVKELRSLLDSWRSAKKVAWKTVIQTLTVGFLSLLAVGLYFKNK
jgi:2-iminoacetate synthase ThiH